MDDLGLQYCLQRGVGMNGNDTIAVFAGARGDVRVIQPSCTRTLYCQENLSEWEKLGKYLNNDVTFIGRLFAARICTSSQFNGVSQSIIVTFPHLTSPYNVFHKAFLMFVYATFKT